MQRQLNSDGYPGQQRSMQPPQTPAHAVADRGSRPGRRLRGPKVRHATSGPGSARRRWRDPARRHHTHVTCGGRSVSVARPIPPAVGDGVKRRRGRHLACAHGWNRRGAITSTAPASRHAVDRTDARRAVHRAQHADEHWRTRRSPRTGDDDVDRPPEHLMTSGSRWSSGSSTTAPSIRGSTHAIRSSSPTPNGSSPRSTSGAGRRVISARVELVGVPSAPLRGAPHSAALDAPWNPGGFLKRVSPAAAGARAGTTS